MMPAFPRISKRGTFDDDRAEPVRCRCGRLVTGVHRCQDGGVCPFECEQGARLHAQPDTEACE